ncbi:MAG TPA: hypothetical protein VHC48_24150 [Puia sp.]|nr:hypothetical protein [Puia sp.]
MFGLFGKSNAPHKCPIPVASQKWIDTAFPFLAKLFGEEKIKNRKVLIPHISDFPIRYDGEEKTAWDTLHIIAARMEVDPNDIVLDIYADATAAVSTGSPLGTKVSLGSYENPDNTDAYTGRQEDGKLHILLEAQRLTDPERMVAYLAHEIARMRLMESPQPEDDHRLADMTTMIFGLGIFNANASFYSPKRGYVLQREWGYALALFARLRGEKDPGWIKHLTPNIRSDFAKSQAYLDDRG